MASQNSTMYAAQIASGAPTVSSTEAGGRVRCVSDTYLTTSAVTAGSQTITLCKLPVGAKVISAELIVPASVGTSSAKLGYGTFDSSGTVTVVDDDRWGSGKDLSSAGRVQFVSVAADSDYVTTSDVAVVLSPVTTNFATAITFAFIIQYVTD